MAHVMSEELVMEKRDFRNNLVVKPVLFGILGGLLLLGFYFAIVSLAATFRHAVDELLALWFWIVPLVVGFGFQAGLFAYVKGYAKVASASAKGSIAASGSLSTLSMAACCAHHVTDFLPLLGLSAAALFLTQYQTVFLTVGVVSNLIGINLMFRIIQKHGFYWESGSWLNRLMALNLKGTLYVLLVAGAAAVGAAYYFR